MRTRSLVPCLALCGTLTITAGCSSIGLGVKPWQHDVLARRDMALDTKSLDFAFDDHIYFSKEAASGGRAFGGGGCGCN